MNRPGAVDAPKIIVVGAGIGGLTCAIDLAIGGARVLVLERDDVPGGKARGAEVGGVAMDGGPTVLTMPWVFDELFASAGASFRDDAGLEQATVLGRHGWIDGTQLDLYADAQRSADAIGKLFGAKDARAYLAFQEDGRRLSALSENAFLRSQRPTIVGLVRKFGPAGLTAFARMDGHRSMWRALEQRFASPRLRQLFGRYATYVGSSPFDAPATLNLIAYVESEGVFRAKDGMRGVVRALEQLARARGVELRYGHAVERVTVASGRATGVVVQGEELAADAVVFNGEVSAVGAGLLGEACARAARPTAARARSFSAVTWAMIAKPGGVPLLNHNVFFSEDYAAEFRMLLRERRVPDEPTVYLCAQDRRDTIQDGPENALERFLLVVNAPATGDDETRWSDQEKERCTNVTMELLRRSGLTLEATATMQSTPVDFHRRFPATGGRALRTSLDGRDGGAVTRGSVVDDAEALSGGRERSSGGRGSDGGAERSSRGDADSRGPRFDRLIPPGGYQWHYLDGVSDDGCLAIVVIALLGNPFSPRYARARRAGPADALRYSSMNVAVYARTRKECAWTLTEQAVSAEARSGEGVAIGASAMRWEGERLVVDIDERTPLGRRVRGKVVLEPETHTNLEIVLDPRAEHRWWPIAPRARVLVELPSLGVPLLGPRVP